MRLLIKVYWLEVKGFNPRTRKGCDKFTSPDRMQLIVSIHAPVKDATCRISLGIIQGMRFNPRTRKGCDDRSAGYPKIVDKFQSTHP